MSITANGLDVLAMRLTLPLQGIWVATLHVSTDVELRGALRIENGGVAYSGTVVRGGAVSGVAIVDAVGGAGGLGKEVDARSYQGASAGSVLADLLTAVGESLDANSTRAVLSAVLPYWTRAAERASLAVSTLAEALSAKWRVLPSGNVWFGTETWPIVERDPEGLELARDAAEGTVLLAPETIALRPGVSFRGDRVGRVEHLMGGSDLRTTYWVAP